MLNDIENKTTLNGMSDLEFDKNKVEMMRYRANGLSYKLGFVAIIFSVLAAFMSLNSFQPITAVVIIKIMMNVVILLGGFLFCEQAKNYSTKASIGLMVLGGVCVARIFWIPLQLIVKYNQLVSFQAEKEQIKEAGGNITDIQAKIDEIGKTLGATITSEFDGGYAVSWLPHSGNFRGIVAIVFLICAAVAFIFAGYLGFIKSKKLNAYMESIKDVKK